MDFFVTSRSEYGSFRALRCQFERKMVINFCRVNLFVGHSTSQQHASVSQWRICSGNFTYCHTEIEVADPTRSATSISVWQHEHIDQAELFLNCNLHATETLNMREIKQLFPLLIFILANPNKSARDSIFQPVSAARRMMESGKKETSLKLSDARSCGLCYERIYVLLLSACEICTILISADRRQASVLKLWEQFIFRFMYISDSSCGLHSASNKYRVIIRSASNKYRVIILRCIFQSTQIAQIHIKLSANTSKTLFIHTV